MLAVLVGIASVDHLIIVAPSPATLLVDLVPPILGIIAGLVMGDVQLRPAYETAKADIERDIQAFREQHALGLTLNSIDKRALLTTRFHFDRGRYALILGTFGLAMSSLATR